MHTDTRQQQQTEGSLPLATALRVLLPFAGGYFLSYLYRTVNAVISPDLISDFNLDASALGLLTSVYFLTFALFQLPLGILLDRFGPRRVESVLLLIAASGAALFAFSDGLQSLIVGRALIGLGVSACLMASFKATTMWFPPERVPAMNAWILASGGLGALAATAPVEAALQITDWRGVLLTLAIVTVLAATLLFTVVPEKPRQAVGGLKDLLNGLVHIYKSAFFWRVVPIMVINQATFLALQTLWAGPWFKDVLGLERDEIAHNLFLIAAAMVAGMLLLGNIATKLSRWGIPLMLTSALTMVFSLIMQLLLILEWLDYALSIWLLLAFSGTGGILIFPLLAQYFPSKLTGRVNAAANVLVFMTAFISQWAIGVIINLWPVADGYAAQGYQAGFGLFLALQIAAFIWFLPALWPKQK